MVAEIHISNGPPCYVDAELVDVPLTYTWSDGVSASIAISSMSFHWHQSNRNRYVRSTTLVGQCRRHVILHRLIAEAPPNLTVDHKDHDTSNNTRSNLRLATHSQNTANKNRIAKGKSRYKGIFIRIRKSGAPRYFAHVRKDGIEYNSNGFDAEDDAAHWYDRKAIELFGEFACLNFPQEPTGNV